MIAYKILTLDEFKTLATLDRFEGSAVDRADGFIHMSTPAQVAATAAKYFAGQDWLILVTVDLSVFTADELRWEPSRGGDLFPHLYCPLPRSAVIRESPLELDADGKHIFPTLST